MTKVDIIDTLTGSLLKGERVDTSKINKLLLDVRRTPTGLKWRLEANLSDSQIKELSAFLHRELGHKVSLSVRDDMVFLSPEGDPPGELVTFQERVLHLFPDPWAKSGQLDGEVDELPLE